MTFKSTAVRGKCWKGARWSKSIWKLLVRYYGPNTLITVKTVTKSLKLISEKPTEEKPCLHSLCVLVVSPGLWQLGAGSWHWPRDLGTCCQVLLVLCIPLQLHPLSVLPFGTEPLQHPGKLHCTHPLGTCECPLAQWGAGLQSLCCHINELYK